jgi:carbonic anhydrase/acetyltransferase-like protein (isoleucine patch superfamily)
MSNSVFITPFNGHRPKIAPSAFVDVSARLIGRVTVSENASIWPGAVLRADEEEIIIGSGSAVLDLCLLDAPHDYKVIVEPGALVSHNACLHGATVKTGALIGIGAIVLDGAVVEEGALVGAGAVVPPKMVVPAGMLMLGQPAKPIRELRQAEKENMAAQLADLLQKARKYKTGNP